MNSTAKLKLPFFIKLQAATLHRPSPQIPLYLFSSCTPDFQYSKAILQTLPILTFINISSQIKQMLQLAPLPTPSTHTHTLFFYLPPHPQFIPKDLNVVSCCVSNFLVEMQNTGYRCLNVTMTDRQKKIALGSFFFSQLNSLC